MGRVFDSFWQLVAPADTQALVDSLCKGWDCSLWEQVCQVTWWSKPSQRWLVFKPTHMVIAFFWDLKVVEGVWADGVCIYVTGRGGLTTVASCLLRSGTSLRARTEKPNLSLCWKAAAWWRVETMADSSQNSRGIKSTRNWASSYCGCIILPFVEGAAFFLQCVCFLSFPQTR